MEPSDTHSIEMYREIDWAVPADPYILEELGEYAGWHTAKSLELNTDFSRQWVSQRCAEYVERGLADRHPESAAYRLTQLGKDLIAGEVSYEEFNDSD